jgi:intein-encoded DNA endonuclease-like protein
MNDLAYVKGVMEGDGSIDRGNQNRPKHGPGKPRLRLEVTSKKFAASFSEALARLNLIPKSYGQDRLTMLKGYACRNHTYTVRATCGEALLDELASLNVEDVNLGLDYIKGFFESEGHFRVTYYSHRECWQWKITNKDLAKLARIKRILSLIGIKSTIYMYANGVHILQIQRRSDIEHLQALGITKVCAKRRKEA